MNNKFPKKLSFDIILFIESIILKYDLEKDFIESDILLKEKMSGLTDLTKRISNKLLYSQQVKGYVLSNKSLEDILASFKIKNIIERLINKDAKYEELNSLLSQSLKTSPDIIKSIEESIKNNQQVKEAIEAEANPIENLEKEEENLNKKTNTNSIGNILLKK